MSARAVGAEACPAAGAFGAAAGVVADAGVDAGVDGAAFAEDDDSPATQRTAFSTKRSMPAVCSGCGLEMMTRPLPKGARATAGESTMMPAGVLFWASSVRNHASTS